MKFFFKNPPKQPLRPLKEKEIQEYLYGRHRSRTVPAAGDLETRIKEALPKQPSFQAVSIRPRNPACANGSAGGTARPKTERFALSGVFTSVPRPLAGIVAGAFVSAILAVSFISSWLGGIQEREERKQAERLRAIPEEREKMIDDSRFLKGERRNRTPESQAAGRSQVSRDTNLEMTSGFMVQSEPPLSSSLASGDPLTNRTPPAASEAPSASAKKKVYAVQICTYQKEQDALALVDQLKQAHFNSFYRRMASQNNRIPFFVVFLGQRESFSEAQSMLSDFRKTELFKNFSDSFVRSL